MFETLQWIVRFARHSPGAGMHLLFRCLGFPYFHHVERNCPLHGRILDMGCGHGLLSLLIAGRGPAREVVGIDMLASRLEVGRTVAAANGRGNVRFERRDFSELPEGRFAAIIFSDALFYYSMERQREILEQCRDKLAEGGVMLIKEQGRRPVWKARLVELQERLLTGVKRRIGRSRGWRSIAADGFYLWNVDQLADFLRSRGLAVEQHPLDAWSYLSHYLLVAWNSRQGST